MKSIRWNNNWKFMFEQNVPEFHNFGFPKFSGASGAPARNYPDNNWDRVTLPHDWAVALPKDLRAENLHGSRAVTWRKSNNLEKKTELEEVYHIGWYRKEFIYDEGWNDKRIFLEFEGIYRDAILWVNGVYIDRHTSGYTGWIVDITDFLLEGINSVAVRVDSDQPEGWFYQGAGIYRDVYFHIAEPVYIKPYHTAVVAEISGNVCAKAVIVNDTDLDVRQNVRWEILDKNGTVCASAETELFVPSYAETEISAEMMVENPLLWDLDHPNLYTLQILAQDTATEVFGFRSIVFDANEGVFLNGKPIKIRGACVHQDFGGVGVALSENLHYYKVQKLKEMGVNAYRTSHYAPSPALLRACDALGMLVMDENRMMSSAPEAMRQLEFLIRRDRNHPCVFVWSIGNEEVFLQSEVWSKTVIDKMTRAIKKLDNTRMVTYASNNSDKYSSRADTAIEVRGINYFGNWHGDGDWSWIETYHKAHPNQPIIGTEDTGFLSSRGGTQNDLVAGKFDYTGYVVCSWGSTPRRWVTFCETHPFICGSFMWTGFDYRGEPWPLTRSQFSSQFGVMDLCGMEKPLFYYFRSWWTKEPVLKIAPHWNYKTGDVARITVYTNCEKVTLFVNGTAIGTKPVETYGMAVWDVPYEPGVISAEGEKDGKRYRDEIHTAGKTEKISASVVLKGETEDSISIVELKGIDADGRMNPLATEKAEISLPSGTIIGVGNGDASDESYEQKPVKKETKYILTFETEGNVFAIPGVIKNEPNYQRQYTEYHPTSREPDDVRIVAFTAGIQPEAKTYTYTTRVSCTETYQYIEFERFGGEAQIFLDGEQISETHAKYIGNRVNNRPYRFYHDISEGEHELKVVVTTKNDYMHGISGYVKLEKIVDEPWHVRLHYGKARVFVKSKEPEKLSVKLVK